MNRKNAYTMKDVAILAGVTQPTVSHVINGTASISPLVTKRVYEAVEELNYRPNALARGLKMNATNTVGIIVPDISNSYYACAAKEIERLLLSRGYISFLTSTEYNPETEKSLVDKMISYNVDGVFVLCEFVSENTVQQFGHYGIPIVFFEKDSNEQDIGCTLSSDNEAGGYLATRHLIENGSRRIAYLGEKMTLYPPRMRYKGYRHALEEAGLPLCKDIVILNDEMIYNFQRGLLYGREILDKKPDAVFASTDIIAFGFIRACTEMGIRIPDDIAIIGYDDIPLAPLMMPSLSSISQPVVKLAEAALDQLFLQIHKKPFEKHIVLEPELVIRESSTRIDLNKEVVDYGFQN